MDRSKHGHNLHPMLLTLATGSNTNCTIVVNSTHVTPQPCRRLVAVTLSQIRAVHAQATGSVAVTPGARWEIKPVDLDGAHRIDTPSHAVINGAPGSDILYCVIIVMACNFHSALVNNVKFSVQAHPGGKCPSLQGQSSAHEVANLCHELHSTFFMHIDIASHYNYAKQ